MFILLLLASVFTQSPIWQCDFEAPIENCFESRNASIGHSCKIVPCTNVETITHCLQVRKRSYDGDCFSKEIKHDVNLEDQSDLLIVEFNYMAVRHPHNQKFSTGCFVGYIEESGSYEPVNWVALSKTPNKLNSTIITNYSFELVDIKDQWTYVRINIHPKSDKPIRLVIEDFVEAQGVSGDFLIANITVYHSQICPINCKVCNSYESCLACNENYLLWRGQCLNDVCQNNVPKLTKDKFKPSYNEAQQNYKIEIKDANFDCYDLSLQLNMKPVEYVQNGGNLDFQFNPKIIAQNCTFSQISNEVGHYLCNFKLTFKLKSTKLIVSTVSWVSIFTVNLNNLAATSLLSTEIQTQQAASIDAVIITIKGEAQICSDSNCISFEKNPKITIGTDFYIFLTINETSFRSIYYPKLTQAFIMGNGTMMQLTINYTKVINKTDGVIYALNMPLVVFNGYLALTAELIYKNIKRDLLSIRILEEQKKSYVIASLIKFETKQSEEDKILEYLPYIVILSVLGFAFLVILISLLIKKFNYSNKKKLLGKTKEQIQNRNQNQNQ